MQIKIKVFKILICCFSFSLVIFSFNNTLCQNLKWANQYNSAGVFWKYSSLQSEIKTKTDNNGNVFSVGIFNGSTYFGGDTSTGVIFASIPSHYIIKHDSSGNFVWVKVIELLKYGTSYFNDLDIDAQGNIYWLGKFDSIVDVEPGVGKKYLEADDTAHAFVCKMTNDGNFVWATKFKINTAQLDDINVDASNNVIVTGSNSKPVIFNPDSNSTTLKGTNNIFFCKFNGLGEFVFAKGLIGNNSFSASLVKSDDDGNIYLYGYFGGVVDFDPDTIQSKIITVLATNDAFLAKYDSLGNYLWVAHMPGLTTDNKTVDIDFDNNKSIYVIGNFGDQINLNSQGSIFLNTMIDCIFFE